MEKSLTIDIDSLFFSGCNFIFKRWTAFRMALDDNPKVLTYYEEDGLTLEINHFLHILFEDILNEIKKDKIGGSFIVEKMADYLNGFMADYFNIFLEDE